jgi:predicted dehydrogenase
LAIIGVGGYGRELISKFANIENCHIGFVCDPDEVRGRSAVELARYKSGRDAIYFQDMRRIFDLKDVDAVVISTPNHWHTLAAVWAMQAGKDVYVEKPVSHSVFEGKYLAEAAKFYRRVVQSGLQLRSYEELRHTIDFLQQGGIGRIKYARCLSFKRRRPIGKAGSYRPPDSLDYNLWCGPAPMSQVTRRQFHYDWHWFWDYGGGGLANNGVHRIDVARWGMGLTGVGDDVFSLGGRFGPQDAGETPNVQVTVHRYGNQFIIHELRGLPTETDPLLESGDGVIFYGTDGILTFGRRKLVLRDLQGRIVRQVSRNGRGSHHRNFLNAVRWGRQEDLHCSAMDGHYSSALCHLGGLSHRLGVVAGEKDIERQLGDAHLPEFFGEIYADTKEYLRSNAVEEDLRLGRLLRFDPEGTEIINDPEGTLMLRSSNREPFILPKLS